MIEATASAMTTGVTMYHAADRQHALIQHEQLVESIPLYKEWQAKAMKSALGLANLPDTWELAGRVRPSAQAIQGALEMIRLAGSIGLDDLPRPFVVPLAGGGVQLEWELGERRVELEIWNEGAPSYLQLKAGEPLPNGEGELWPLNQAKDLFGWLQATE